MTNTQTCEDEEIEHHFMEEVSWTIKIYCVFFQMLIFLKSNILYLVFVKTYVKRFETNLNELNELYNKCLDNFEVAFSLYPKSARVAELKEKYGYFFKLFAESSPISKALSVGNANCKLRPSGGETDEDQFIPRFSLGLSQMTPKNLRTDIDQHSDSPIKGICGGSTISTQEKTEVKKGCDDIIGHTGLPKKNIMAEVPRPRRGIFPSHFLKSPFVSRVVDVNAHQITTEERNVWEWLFNTRKNIK